jgi:ABC-type transport system substrate-binding protein
MSNKKIFFILLMVVSLAAGLIGCQPTPEVTPAVTTVIETVVVQGTPQVVEKTVEVTAVPTESPAVSKEGGVFTWGMPDEFPGFNPILNDDYVELYLFGLNAEPLTWGGENYPTELRPILAESWDVSEDGKVWTIHLRQGVS